MVLIYYNVILFHHRLNTNNAFSANSLVQRSLLDQVDLVPRDHVTFPYNLVKDCTILFFLEMLVLHFGFNF